MKGKQGKQRRQKEGKQMQLKTQNFPTLYSLLPIPFTFCPVLGEALETLFAERSLHGPNACSTEGTTEQPDAKLIAIV